MKKLIQTALLLLLTCSIGMTQTTISCTPSADGTWTISSTNVGAKAKDPNMVLTNELLGFVRAKRSSTITVSGSKFDVTYVESTKQYLVSTPDKKEQFGTLEAAKALLKSEIYLFIQKKQVSK